MSRPAWGTAPIRCGKTKCKWRGYETDLKSVPHPKFNSATQSVCPACGCDSYMHMTEREIKAWKCAADTAETRDAPQAQPEPYDGRFDECIARDYAKHGRLGS